VSPKEHEGCRRGGAVDQELDRVHLLVQASLA
jgi:hypothetical protein